MPKVDIFAALAYIASGGLAGASVALATLWPHAQIQIVQGSAIIVGVAGLLVRLIKNPTTPTPPSPEAPNTK